MITVLEKPAPFGGGVALPPNKSMSLQVPLSDAAIPALLTLPLRQHIGIAAEPLVKPGDHVLTGQVIARSRGVVSAPLHASASGVVKEIADYELPSPSRVVAPSIVIETDGEDNWIETEADNFVDYLNTSPVAIQQRILQSGIVGLGGAGFPSAVKLIPGLSLEIELLIINAAECEPYISCDESLIRNHVEELITGIDILAHALQADACVIAIEENKIEAIEILQQALSAHPASGIELKIISSLYPAGGERQLIKSITGMAVPADGLPVDIGVVCYNVGTTYAVQQAVMNNRPLVSRVVTVTGPGIQTPCNKHVRLGTSMADLVKQCGGYTDDFEYLIMGGPMMGIRLENDAVPVIKTTNCLLAAGKPLVAAQQAEQPCIRCDECANVCPANLQPQQLHWHSKVFNAERLQDYRLFDCIECGCCSYVCPSHIPLVERYRLAKSTIWEERRKQMDASHSRRRFEEKQVRDQRRALARKSRRQAGQTDTVASVSDRDRKQQEIAAAVNRVRKKREEKG